MNDSYGVTFAIDNFRAGNIADNIRWDIEATSGNPRQTFTEATQVRAEIYLELGSWRIGLFD